MQAYPLEVTKLVYCSRTVPEIEKVPDILYVYNPLNKKINKNILIAFQICFSSLIMYVFSASSLLLPGCGRAKKTNGLLQKANRSKKRLPRTGTFFTEKPVHSS